MILHIDMDAFYAAVEVRDRPELAGRCVVVGGSSRRGVVSAANYPARRFGVHSAMPVFEARRRCPRAVFIQPRMPRYRAVSRRIMSILAVYSPLFEPVSIDEAYLDISGCERLHGDARTTALHIKQTVFEKTGLTCSIGAAPLRFLAKIASDMDKPDGLTIIAPHEVAAFIQRLPIQHVPGVGVVALKKLNALGIFHLGDVRKIPCALLKTHLGKFGDRLAALAGGVDPTPVCPDASRKSVSSETTLEQNTRDLNFLKTLLLDHAQTVAQTLRDRGFRSRTITLKIKYADFRQITRRCTIADPTQSSSAVYRAAAGLLGQCGLPLPVRLIGVGAADLVCHNVPRQLDLFTQSGGREARWEQIDHTLDRIRRRFGAAAVLRGTLAGKKTL